MSHTLFLSWDVDSALGEVGQEKELPQRQSELSRGSSKAHVSPEEEHQSLHPDRFPKGFLEEVAAELDFEGIGVGLGNEK